MWPTSRIGRVLKQPHECLLGDDWVNADIGFQSTNERMAIVEQKESTHSLLWTKLQEEHGLCLSVDSLLERRARLHSASMDPDRRIGVNRRITN